MYSDPKCSCPDVPSKWGGPRCDPQAGLGMRPSSRNSTGNFFYHVQRVLWSCTGQQRLPRLQGRSTKGRSTAGIASGALRGQAVGQGGFVQKYPYLRAVMGWDRVFFTEIPISAGSDGVGQLFCAGLPTSDGDVASGTPSRPQAWQKQCTGLVK